MGAAVLREAMRRAAADLGAEKLELEAFAHNERALRLYGRLGFFREGLKRRDARARDGERYFDAVQMGYFFDPALNESAARGEADGT